MTTNHLHSWDGRRSVMIFLRQPRITCSSLLCRAVDAIFFHSGNLGHSALSPKIVISSSLIISQMESSCVYLVIDKPLKSCYLRKNTELEAKSTLLFVWVQCQKHQHPQESVMSCGITFMSHAPSMDRSLNRKYGISFIRRHHNHDKIIIYSTLNTKFIPFILYDLSIFEPQDRQQWYYSNHEQMGISQWDKTLSSLQCNMPRSLPLRSCGYR